MEEIIKYENRESLYSFLLDDFGLKKIEEKYYPENFGNFHIVLTATDFLLRYFNDRSILSVEIASKYENGDDKWYALSFIKDLIYDPENINANKAETDNSKRIGRLNNFLRQDFDKISELFSKQNYPNTRKRLDAELKKQFYLKFPSAKR